MSEKFLPLNMPEAEYQPYIDEMIRSALKLTKYNPIQENQEAF